jgi:hypothetical protein
MLKLADHEFSSVKQEIEKYHKFPSSFQSVVSEVDEDLRTVIFSFREEFR